MRPTTSGRPPELHAPDAGLDLLIPLVRIEPGQEADRLQLRHGRGQPPLEHGHVVRFGQSDVAARELDQVHRHRIAVVKALVEEAVHALGRWRLEAEEQFEVEPFDIAVEQALVELLRPVAQLSGVVLAVRGPLTCRAILYALMTPVATSSS